jgi:hypothetical protein
MKNEFEIMQSGGRITKKAQAGLGKRPNGKSQNRFTTDRQV